MERDSKGSSGGFPGVFEKKTESLPGSSAHEVKYRVPACPPIASATAIALA